MSRIVPAVAAGLVLSQAVAMFVWWWGFYLFPPSPLYDLNPALAHVHPGGLPFAALFWQALGQGLGALLGGLWALRRAPQAQGAVWAVAAGAFGLAIAWIVLYPRPVWFLALSALLIGAGAWAAGRIAAGDLAGVFNHQAHPAHPPSPRPSRARQRKKAEPQRARRK